MKKKYYWIIGAIVIIVGIIAYFFLTPSNYCQTDSDCRCATHYCRCIDNQCFSLNSDCNYDCLINFIDWCKDFHGRSYPLPSDIADCMTFCNPMNMPLPEEKVRVTMNYLCEYFGVKL